jgi:hypothetical protein
VIDARQRAIVAERPSHRALHLARHERLELLVAAEPVAELLGRVRDGGAVEVPDRDRRAAARERASGGAADSACRE